VLDRRNGADRRKSSVSGPAITIERRSGEDRRKNVRRMGVERRLESQSDAEQIRAAIALLARVVDIGRMDDNERRFLDAAILRLTFVLNKLPH
jgi:hypothetical protein